MRKHLTDEVEQSKSKKQSKVVCGKNTSSVANATASPRGGSLCNIKPFPSGGEGVCEQCSQTDEVVLHKQITTPVIFFTKKYSHSKVKFFSLPRLFFIFLFSKVFRFVKIEKEIFYFFKEKAATK
ncbi:MAG: hypothetical protein IJS44_00355 [Clostridia bacterium]|nr:hypothetical protein [Clostridia bacterium]